MIGLSQSNVSSKSCIIIFVFILRFDAAASKLVCISLSSPSTLQDQP